MTDTLANPKLQKALSQVDMLPDESVQFALQADGYFQGSNPLAKLIGKLQALLVTLTGGHVRIFLAVTNLRVLLLESRAVWCGCTKVAGVNNISLGSIAEVGTSKETQLCFFHARVVHVQSPTQQHTLVITRAGDQAVRDFMANMSAVMVRNRAPRDVEG